MEPKQLVYRASDIWGMRRIVGTRVMTDGGLDVTLLRLGRAGDDTRERAGTFHRLNADGHPICHADCQTLAAEVDAQ